MKRVYVALLCKIAKPRARARYCSRLFGLWRVAQLDMTLVIRTLYGRNTNAMNFHAKFSDVPIRNELLIIINGRVIMKSK